MHRALRRPLSIAAAGFLAIAPLVVGPGRAQAEDLPPLRGEAPPYFTSDFLISLDSNQRPELGVSISLPYTELEWI